MTNRIAIFLVVLSIAANARAEQSRYVSTMIPAAPLILKGQIPELYTYAQKFNEDIDIEGLVKGELDSKFKYQGPKTVAWGWSDIIGWAMLRFDNQSTRSQEVFLRFNSPEEHVFMYPKGNPISEVVR